MVVKLDSWGVSVWDFMSGISFLTGLGSHKICCIFLTTSIFKCCWHIRDPQYYAWFKCFVLKIEMLSLSLLDGNRIVNTLPTACSHWCVGHAYIIRGRTDPYQENAESTFQACFCEFVAATYWKKLTKLGLYSWASQLEAHPPTESFDVKGVPHGLEQRSSLSN